MRGLVNLIFWLKKHKLYSKSKSIIVLLFLSNCHWLTILTPEITLMTIKDVENTTCRSFEQEKKVFHVYLNLASYGKWSIHG